MHQSLNVLGEKIHECGCDPMTGWYRDGYCHTDHHDRGIHTVCCVVTADFLAFSKKAGNDLSTPVPGGQFPGLKPGDHWCLCAGRWLEAYHAGHACPIMLESCHEETLAMIPLKYLQEFAVKN
jgi:uncharacterized protein (DUF2237 family)